MNPNIKENVGGYTLTWDNLSIKVSRLKRHRDNRVNGDVLITTTAEGYSPILVPSFSHNFKADRSRKGLIKDLVEQFPDMWDWPTIIDQLCHYVPDLLNRGEPVKHLSTTKMMARPDYLVYPLLFDGVPNVIYGDKGVLKSTLSYLLMICLTMGWTDNPFGFRVPDRGIQCLLLDWEVEDYIALSCVEDIKRGLDLPDIDFNYKRCHSPLIEDLEEIDEIATENNAEVIIIDSLGPAVGGDLLKTPEALGFMAGLRKLRRTSLCVGQQSKGLDKTKSVFGCYSEDTEVLTNKGWLKHSEIKEGDKIICYDPTYKCLRIDSFLKKWEYDYEGDMVHIKHKASEAMITPNHKVLTTNYGEIQAERLKHFVNPAYKLPYNNTLKPYGKHHRQRGLGFTHYELLISKQSRRTITINRSNIKTVPYKGKVHCLTVPTGYYVTRYNGRVAILGNSTYFQYLSRNIFELCKSDSDPSGQKNISVALFHRYCNLGALQKPMGFRATFDKSEGTIIEREDVDYIEFIGRVNRQTQILELLKQRGALATQQIMKELEINRGNADVTLGRLASKNKITRIGTVWALASDETEAPAPKQEDLFIKEIEEDEF